MTKPDGMLGICIDYFAANAISVKDCYSLPHIEDLLNSLHSSCQFTKFDLVTRYIQICIATADRQMRAFTTEFGLYEWRVVLFGLANTPSNLMLITNYILKSMKCKFVIRYLYYTVIQCRTLEEYMVHVRQVLTILTAHRNKPKHAKCTWACPKVNFCGFGLDKDGLHTHELMTHAVMDWPQPENSMDLRGFLGLTSNYWKTIEHYAHIAMPLHAMGTLPTRKEGIGRQCG